MAFGDNILFLISLLESKARIVRPEVEATAARIDKMTKAKLLKLKLKPTKERNIHVGGIKAGIILIIKIKSITPIEARIIYSFYRL